MYTKTILFLCFFIILISNNVLARELTLSQTIKLAEGNSKELKLAQMELELADARVDEAWAMALPTIKVDLNYNKNLKDQIFYATIPDFITGEPTIQKFDMSFENEFSATAKLEQTLYSFGKVGTALEIAYEYEDFADKNYNYQRRQILINTKIGFYNALLAKNIYELNRDSEESARENYDETRQRFDSGVASEFELLQSEVRWRNAIPSAISAKKEYEFALNNLKSMISLPIKEEISLKGSLEELPDMPSDIYLEEVLNHRSDFQAMLLEGSMRDKNIAIEFANHYPTLKGRFSYLFSAQSDAFKVENDFDNYVLGLTLSIPIYSGGNTSALVQKARIEYNQAELRIAQTRDRIEMDLNNVVLNIREAKERIVAADMNVSAAQRTYDIAEARLNNGMATQLELKDSRIFLDQAKINYLTARFDYLKAYYQWQLATGIWQEEN